MAEDAPDMQVTGNLERRVKKLEGKMRRLQSRVGGVGKGEVDSGLLRRLKSQTGLAVTRRDWQDWTKVTTFLNGWAAISDPAFGDRPRYLRTAEGIVLLQGAVHSGTVGASAFKLPSGYRPLYSLRFSVSVGSSAPFGLGTITVQDDGDVIISEAPSTDWVPITCMFLDKGF